MTNEYDYGDPVRVKTTTAFQDIDGTAFDPNTVKIKYRAPGGSVITKEYGTDAEVVKDGTGLYHMDIDTRVVSASAADGYWLYRIEGLTGGGESRGADDNKFRVNVSALA